MVLWTIGRISKSVSILLIVLLLFFTISPYLEQPTAEYFNDPFSKNITTYINNNPAVILPSSVCAGYSHIVTFVTSAPNHFELRRAIRETWGSIKTVANYHINTYFILGRTKNTRIEEMVKEESQIYDDIVVEDFVDTYYNLTIKSLMLLKTVNRHCLSHAKYVFKADDDVFVNLPLLVEDLKPHQSDSYLLMGSEFVNGTVERRRWSKWYVPEAAYESSKYPSFLSGNAYIFSVNLVPKLLEAAVNVPMFHLEDVYVTGFLTKILNIGLTHNPKFHTQKVASVPCEYKDQTTTHYNIAHEYEMLFEMIYVVGDLDSQCRDYKSSPF